MWRDRAMTATLTTLVSFNVGKGLEPDATLTTDSTGDLFGITEVRRGNYDGTVFEVAKTAGGYAATPTTLVSFNVDQPAQFAGLLADANGDLFGTTEPFVQNNGDFGSVFEIAKTAGGYASTPIILANIGGSEAGLTADSNGDLFGTTFGGSALGYGTVFEVARTAGGYASPPTTLISFNITDGERADGSLIVDANGDLFGTTGQGGASGAGTVFEIPKTAGGYASTPTTLVSFSGGADGGSPLTGLIADANGDLFGTTVDTVFEIKKTAAGYASAATTLVLFNGANGSEPFGGLLADASGDLFGTTSAGGLNNDGC